MIQKINMLTKFPLWIHKQLTPSLRESKVSQLFIPPTRTSGRSVDVVLVQCVEDLYYFGLFGQIISMLRMQRPIRAEQFVLNSLRKGESRSVLYFFGSRFANWLSGTKWIGLYRFFCDEVGYSSMSYKFPLGDVIDAFRAFRFWRELTDKDALIAHVIDKVHVGDLIYDSYLRFKPAPTVDIEDAYLWRVIWQAHRDVRRAKDYFSRVRPKLYLTSYCVYIQHGIAVRVALQCGVRVFSFGNGQEFAKQLSMEDWVQTKNADAYVDDFSRMGGVEQKLAEADAALSARMAGTIDGATAYMKKSAYIESDEIIPDVQGAAVVFLHDFFDSPHGYRHMVFSDFWEWICFTIETLEKSNGRFFLKPHPNQIDLNDGVLSALTKRYPNVSIISPNITNKQLAQAGLACAVTAYGTVAHEMAYLGVPTIGCGDNPHVAFSFCTTTKSKAEYAEALCRYAELKFDKAAMHRQSLVFYYMHNLSASAEEKTLLQMVRKWYQLCANEEFRGEELLGVLIGISELKGFKGYISKFAGAMNRI